MKKIILSCMFVLFLVTGCSNKTALTNEQFIEKLKAQNYFVEDVTYQYQDYSYIQSATVAQYNDEYQIEFYILDNEDNALNMFDMNKLKFESFKENSSSESMVNIKNYSTYSLTSNGYYMYLCRVDNTLLYVKVSDMYKDNIKTLTEELGY